MKLIEITEAEVPLIYHLLRNLIKKHERIEFNRFKREQNVVWQVELSYDDIQDADYLRITFNDEAAKSFAFHTIAWVIPNHSDRLEIKKVGDHWELIDPSYLLPNFQDPV